MTDTTPSPVIFGTFGTTVVAVGTRPEGHPDAARQLEKAGFAYLPDAGVHELPTGTHPQDAGLRIEFAADLLAADGADGLGIDPDLTRWLEQPARRLAAHTRTPGLPDPGSTPSPTSPAPHGGPASPTRPR
ncbi:hypothetical protein [Kitasatospora sp. A2-31]|uniref:hypothetical protein n=1 Tax=Kitasatospora sp. A2-31 TaxID=2916414 RepID=UPI001EEC66AA|nr:hypothetical protein [Kitasatospora sp. A2-31]MCG6497001.1 hypothetical protein [Kitasatospora sp. A2-31]